MKNKKYWILEYRSTSNETFYVGMIIDKDASLIVGSVVFTRDINSAMLFLAQSEATQYLESIILQYPKVFSRTYPVKVFLKHTIIYSICKDS